MNHCLNDRYAILKISLFVNKMLDIVAVLCSNRRYFQELNQSNKHMREKIQPENIETKKSISSIYQCLALEF